ncbi:hypothetical protein B0J17DRAFT_718007 [Rhizoctonia solani]|nr:hypothetical protein B0J17DRAFT_718007 [Rhizoctonia solani]
MHNGALPLGSLLSSKLKPKPQASLSPEFTHILFFDSTQLLSGILSSHGKIDYAIATCGTKTAISCPERSNNVAIIEWKEGWVDTEGSKLCLNEWVDKPKWSSSNSHAFKKWGNNPAIKWEVNEGNWKATNPQKQTLATFVARRGTLTSQIELTNTGKPYTDALVLTGLLSVAGKKEWKWHNYVEAKGIPSKLGFETLLIGEE